MVFERQGGEDDSYMTIRFAERFDHKLNDRIKLWEAVEFLPEVDDWSNYVVNGEIGFETQLSKHFVQRLYVQDTYDAKPAPGREQNDLKLVAALAYKF